MDGALKLGALAAQVLCGFRFVPDIRTFQFGVDLD